MATGYNQGLVVKCYGLKRESTLLSQTPDEKLDWNQQAEIISGWSRAEVLGKNLPDVVTLPSTAKLITGVWLIFLRQAKAQIFLDRRIYISW